MKTVTPKEMRSLERHSEKEGVSADALMERAGLLAARKAWMLLEGKAHSAQITLLVGAGNNGSDGLNPDPNAPLPPRGAMKVYAFPLNKGGLVAGPRPSRGARGAGRSSH